MKLPQVFSRFRRAGTIDALYGMIVAQARLPVFYRDYGVADTVNGRFDLIILHLALVLRRTGKSGGSLQKLGQGVFDRFCLDMDENLREMGVGDLSVPKHMQKVGAAFFGRSQAYDVGLAGDDVTLNAAITRNVYGGIAGDGAPRLAAYMRATAARLEAQRDGSLARGELEFPDPNSVTSGA